MRMDPVQRSPIRSERSTSLMRGWVGVFTCRSADWRAWW